MSSSQAGFDPLDLNLAESVTWGGIGAHAMEAASCPFLPPLRTIDQTAGRLSGPPRTGPPSQTSRAPGQGHEDSPAVNTQPRCCRLCSEATTRTVCVTAP